MTSKPQSQLNRSHHGFTGSTNTNRFNDNESYSSKLGTEDNNYSNGSFSGSNDYDNKYQKRSNKYGSMPLQSFLVWRILPCLLLVLIPWVPNQFVRNQVKSKKLSIDTIIQEQKDLVKSLDETTENIKELKHEVENLYKDNDLSYQELRHHGKTPENIAAGDKLVTEGSSVTDMESEEYAKMEELEEVLVNRIDRLEKTIRKDAAKRLGDRYALVFFS